MFLYKHHVENTIPAYSSYILHTVNNRRSEKLEYIKSLQEASKYLNTLILGNRRSPVKVKVLKFESAQMTLRLPEGLKFELQIFRIEKSVFKPLDRLSTILTSSSYPLNLIETIFSEDFSKYRCIKEAKKLVVTKSRLYSARETIDWSAFPPRTHFSIGNSFKGYFWSLFEHWRRTRPAPDICFSAGFKSLEDVFQIFRNMCKRFNVKERNSIIPISIDDASFVKVSYKQVDKKRYESYGMPYFVYMEVVENLTGI